MFGMRRVGVLASCSLACAATAAITGADAQDTLAPPRGGVAPAAVPEIGVPVPLSRRESVRPYWSANLGRGPQDIDGAAGAFFNEEGVAYLLSAGASVPRGRGELGAEIAYVGTRDLDVAQEGDVEVRFKGPKVQVTYAFSF